VLRIVLSRGFVEALLISSPSLYFSVMDSRGFIASFPFPQGNDYIGDSIIRYEEQIPGPRFFPLVFRVILPWEWALILPVGEFWILSEPKGSDIILLNME